MTEATRADRVWGVVSAHAEGLGVAVSVRSLCQAAAARLPVSGVAVSVRGELMVSEVLCATGGLSRELEELQQLTVGEGPSLEVLASGASVLVGELDCAPVQARWPLFAAAAVEAGARALFALPLRVGALRGGVFVLASDRPGRLPGEDLAEAWVFAGFALRLVLDEQAGVNSREGYCMSRPYRSVSRSCSLSGVTRMTGDRLARTFVELADTLVDEFDLVEFLHLLVDRCVELLEVSAAGLLLGDSHDQLRVMASSAEDIHLLELFQLQNNDGPCLDCYRTGEPVSHPDLSVAADRWPLFAPAATESGFRTVHALPMRLRSRVIGALNLFHTDPNALAPEVTRIGQALADVATIGLIQERALHHHDTLVDQLQTALDSRVLIEQAKGVLAERHHIDPGNAFTLLRNHARHHGQRLTELATAVIDGSTTTELLPGASPPTRRARKTG